MIYPRSRVLAYISMSFHHIKIKIDLTSEIALQCSPQRLPGLIRCCYPDELHQTWFNIPKAKL